MLNVQVNSNESTEDGIPAGPIHAVPVIAKYHMIDSIPIPGNGVTLPPATLNNVGQEITIVNDSNRAAGPAGPANVFPMPLDTIQALGLGVPLGMVTFLPAIGSTITLICAAPNKWMIKSLV